MSSNLFEVLFTHMMVDLLATTVRDSIRRQGDDMIIPTWMFASEQDRNNEQRIQEISERIHIDMRDASDRLFRELFSLNDEEDEDEELVEPLIPNWLYQEEIPRRQLVQATARIERRPPMGTQNGAMGTIGEVISVNDYASLYPSSMVHHEPRFRFIAASNSMPFVPFTVLSRYKFDCFEPFKQSKTIEKTIDKARNTECPITYEDIKFGDAYMTCGECKYNFSEEAIMKHLNEKRSCPMCRCDWQDACKYINIIPVELRTKNIIKNLSVINNVCSKEFAKNYNILGEVKSGRYNKRWNYGK